MRRLFALIGIFFLSAAVMFAQTSEVKDLNINVSLSEDGTAHITEVWKISVSAGTEWYLVRSNLGDISITDLSVTDESGTQYKNEGSWDVDRSLERKAGKCGIVSKRNGCEICWGLGSYGSHTYTVSYNMTNAVKSLNDYDMIHMQFVSPGLSAAPKHVKVTLSAPVALSDDNARIWGFGFYGDINYSDGKVVAESDRSFSYESSVIELIRFNKGVFSSSSVQDKNFQDVLDTALNGSDFAEGYEEDDGILGGFIAFFTIIISVLGLVKLSMRKLRKNILGLTDMKQIQWCRDLPFKGNIMQSYWVLNKLGLKKDHSFAQAMILRMIKDGQLTVRKDDKERVEIYFSDNQELVNSMPKSQIELFNMMKEASGSDHILQNKEFSRWSKTYYKRVNNWINSTINEGWAGMASDRYAAGISSLTPEGQAEARKVIGFKQFLSDFTLSNERTSQEVGLWQDYLIFASLYGIADKVAKELKDINPQLFEEAVGMDPVTYINVMNMSNNMARSITNAKAAAAEAAARAQAGHGGHTSFGGGGGFSGGGFGGGAR